MVSKIIKKENLLENIIRVICYISIPLCLLMCLTLLSSYFLNGSISSDVNKMTSLGQVIICFSIPMFISLVILPVLVKLFLQKERLSNIGFHRQTKVDWNIVLYRIPYGGYVVLHKAGKQSKYDNTGECNHYSVFGCCDIRRNYITWCYYG